MGRSFSIPQSKLDEIRKTFPHEMNQKKQAVLYWINTDPEASWRRLIQILDGIQETEVANSIRSNSEPIKGIDKNAYMFMYSCNWRGGVVYELYIHGTLG